MRRERRGGLRPHEQRQLEQEVTTKFDTAFGEIPESECVFDASRGGGKGGQAVNTTSNNVEVRWHIGRSTSLTQEQKQRLREQAASRITKGDELVFTSHSERSQLQNRRDALTKLSEFVRESLTEQAERKEKKKTKGVKAKERRGREQKKTKKAGRKKVDRNNW